MALRKCLTKNHSRRRKEVWLSASVWPEKKDTRMQKKTWVYNPQSGGVKIPQNIQPRIRQRILAHAKKRYAGKYNRIRVRFRGQFCYIDTYVEPFVPEDYDPKLWGKSRENRIERLRNLPMHLCRLRYFGGENR